MKLVVVEIGTMINTITIRINNIIIRIIIMKKIKDIIINKNNMIKMDTKGTINNLRNMDNMIRKKNILRQMKIVS